MLRPLHSEFPLLWVIFFPPFGQLFFPPERSFSQTISAESIQDITGTDAALLGPPVSYRPRRRKFHQKEAAK